jgi:CRP/FNR family transcriptional regulator, cyclic AMP receptor protein
MLMRFGKDVKTKLISGVPLFAQCSKGELQEIAAIADEIDIAEGKQLTTEGSPGREFFVIIEGTASVAQDGDQINELGPGDFFGEVALVKDTPRTATVTATSPVRALVVTRQNFKRLIEQQPDIERTVLKALVDRSP